MPRRAAARAAAAPLDAVTRALARRLLREATFFDHHPPARALLTAHPALPPAAARPLRSFLGGGAFYLPTRSSGNSAAAAVRAALRARPPRSPRGRGAAAAAAAAAPAADVDAGFAALRYLSGVAAVARRHGLDECAPPPRAPHPDARLLATPAAGTILLAHPMLDAPFARTAVLLLDAPRGSARRGGCGARAGPRGVVLNDASSLAGETAATLTAAAAGGMLVPATARLASAGAAARGCAAAGGPPPRVRVVSVPLPGGAGADNSGDGQYAVVVAVVGDESGADDEEEAFEGGGPSPWPGDRADAAASPAPPPVALDLRAAAIEGPRDDGGGGGGSAAARPAAPPAAVSDEENDDASPLLPPALQAAPLHWGGPVPAVTALHACGEAAGGVPVPAPRLAVARAAPTSGRRRRRRATPPPPPPPPLVHVGGDVAAAVAAAPPGAAAAGRAVRLYAGAAAWGRRQLAAEVASGAWIVAALPAGDVRRAALGTGGGAGGSDGVWEAGLTALGGDVAALAAVPVDAAAEAADVVV